MESHESAGIPEEEYVRLRRRTMLEHGLHFGVLWAMMCLRKAYEAYSKSESSWGFDIFGAFVIGPFAGWFMAYIAWGASQDTVLAEYKKRRRLEPQRKPVDNKVVQLDSILCVAGLAVMALDLWLSQRTLKDYAAPAAIIAAVMAVAAKARAMRWEAYYQWLTSEVDARHTPEQILLASGWVWAVLPLTIPFPTIPVFTLLMCFFILFYPLDRALTLRSQREFGGGAGDAADA